MLKKHFVILVPGLGDEIPAIQLLVGFYRNVELEIIAYRIGWRDGKNFQPKFERLLKLVDTLSKTGKVSLIGCSAGGSAVLNAFCERKRTIYRMVNVCGRLRVGPTTGFRSFENATKTSTAFADSVMLAEKREKSLTEKDRSRIMTVRPLFDEIVPPGTQIMSGATNIQIPSVEHVFSIALALTVFSKRIMQFLTV